MKPYREIATKNRKQITFTDGFKLGSFKLNGTRDLNFYQPEQIKRVRVVKRADGFYCQFLINVERSEPHLPTDKAVGIDLGLEFFYTDSDGNQVENPRFLRKSEKSLKRLQRRVSKKKKGSKNRKKAINKMARKHLKVSRQRREFAVRTARALVASSDVIVYEDLKLLAVPVASIVHLYPDSSHIFQKLPFIQSKDFAESAPLSNVQVEIVTV